ncbi:hypothetical protein LTR78_008571 [Recurvomyces mirabilis]|uniref:Uncharacterized protein n=1 Tax=Recurvomyces mirabilis TaxID=574656 RepID=A0AAE0WFM8_9PEZI|nr:hypothetical protein LTR78_008571 [Recurvomyces mirabilis]KAK5153517.1 hypothetical protein LTS14_007688 [Recurvomyces mirabilis]
MPSSLARFTLWALLGLAQCKAATYSQSPLGFNRDSSMTVVLKDTITVKHPADVANVNIRVKASGETKADAFRLTRERLASVEEALSSFMPAKKGGVGEAGWNASGVEIDYSHRWKGDGIEDDMDSEDGAKKSTNKTIKAVGRLCARFHDVDMLRAFATEIVKRQQDVTFGEIDWDMSKSARRGAQVEQRRNALMQFVEAGEDWSTTLGYGKSTVVELEEMYSYVSSSSEERGRCGRSWYEFEDEEEEEKESVLAKLLGKEWEVPLAELNTEMKCTLRLE